MSSSFRRLSGDDQAMKPNPELCDQLIEYARNLADKRGWPWHETVEVVSASEGGEPVWLIRTNTLKRGQNIRVTLRRSDHSLISCGFLSR